MAVCTRCRRFNEARREAPGSQHLTGGVLQRLTASMRPGAKRRDHADCPRAGAVPELFASMRPGAKRRDHRHRRAAGAGDNPASMRPGAKRRDHARVHAHVHARLSRASMRPGAKITAPSSRRPRRLSMRPGAKRRDHGPDTGCHTISSCAALCERSPNVLTASPTEPLKPDTIRYRHWSARSAGAAPPT